MNISESGRSITLSRMATVIEQREPRRASTSHRHYQVIQLGISLNFSHSSSKNRPKRSSSLEANLMGPFPSKEVYERRGKAMVR